MKRRKTLLPSSEPTHSSIELSSFNRKEFPLMLAAAFATENRNPNSRSLLKRLLRSYLALITAPARSPLPHFLFLPSGLLSLLPLLLTSSSPSLAALSAEVVGAAAVSSLEANLTIVSDKRLVAGLVMAVGSQNQRVTEAACNAVMDLSASSNGRERLREFSVIEKLLSLLRQSVASQIGFHSLLHRKKSDNLLELILDAALNLINTSGAGYLERIPEDLSKKVLPLLKELWKSFHNMELTSNCNREQSYVHGRSCELATAIFRLSVDQVFHVVWKTNEVRIGVFGDEEPIFEKFMLHSWEMFPRLIKGSWNNLEGKNSIFSSLSDCFEGIKDDNILTLFFKQLVSCPPVASDELDIITFLEEVSDELGSQITYIQDIRVLKTVKHTSDSMQETVDEEVHFFKDRMGSEVLGEFSFQKFKEALQDGYTIAMRGMEFRVNEVAAISKGLSDLFGQPSVGANLYLTPPRSQGLAKHYDDHCVFVWQIFGQKQWRISSRSEGFLPRLYEPPCALQSLSQDECGYMDVLIREGDILYIPRGYPHEAHTINNLDDSCNGMPCDVSMHLTFGIEVEPPFEINEGMCYLDSVCSRYMRGDKVKFTTLGPRDGGHVTFNDNRRGKIIGIRWEGFAHIALHCWSQKGKQHSGYPVDYEMMKLRSTLVNMLHVTVKLIANESILFKKACLVGGHCFTHNFNLNHDEPSIILNQKSTFYCIIDTIRNSSSFSETFISIVTAVHENNVDFFQWMRWLRHLHQEGDEKVNFDNPFELFEEFVLLNSSHAKEIMMEFSRIKSEFCESVVFEDTCDEFMAVLEKYRKCRTQYMNGMMSLHTSLL